MYMYVGGHSNTQTLKHNMHSTTDGWKLHEVEFLMLNWCVSYDWKKKWFVSVGIKVLNGEPCGIVVLGAVIMTFNQKLDTHITPSYSFFYFE